MTFVNRYTPAPEPKVPEGELYGPNPYDINFAYPLHEETLTTDRLKIVPFVPAVHAETYWAQVGHRPELFRYFPFFLATLAEFLAWVERTQRRNPHNIFLAVLDRTRADAAHPAWGGSLAGVMSVCNTAPQNLTTELGYVVVFPEFQHTHVAKEMVAVVLRYLLELPSASPPGIGLRRVQWSAHPENRPSIRLAERMGFRREGTVRWLLVLPAALTEAGDRAREGDSYPGRSGRHAALLSVCWDDWENGVKEHVRSTRDERTKAGSIS